MGLRLKGAAGWLAGWEPVVVAGTAPLLWFPTFRPAWTAAALAVLLLVWLLRWLGAGRPGVRTPFDVSLLLLLLMVPVAVWASALPELTLPKLTGLVLGVAVFRATVHAARTPRSLGWVAALFLALGAGLAGLGLVGTSWAGKLPGLEPLLARIPQLVSGLPGAEVGIHANELGGTLSLFLPLSLAACCIQAADCGRAGGLVRIAALLLTLFLAAVLVLTQSRSAWLGVLVGFGVMVWLRWRWLGWLLVGMALALVLGIWVAGPTAMTQAFFPSEPALGSETVVGAVDLAGRVEIWSRALYAIQDFPFTGCGLGTFRRVVHVLYPLFLAPPDADVGHAHNVFLQVALDVGIPGLVAYLALVGTAVWIGWRVVRTVEPGAGGTSRPTCCLAMGIVGSLVAFHVYGLTDAIALGAKPGVALWMLLALAAVLWSTTPAAWPAAEATRRSPAAVELPGAEGP